MRTARLLRLLVPTLLAPATAIGQGPNLRTQVPGVEGVVLLDSIAIRKAASGPVDKVLEAIDAVYDELGIPAEAVGAQGRLRNRHVTLSRRLGKQALSLYLDCGRGFSGNNADFYKVSLATAAWPEPASGNATAIHIALIGGGQDPAGSRSGYVLCTSRGTFEEEFAKRVRARLAPPPPGS